MIFILEESKSIEGNSNSEKATADFSDSKAYRELIKDVTQSKASAIECATKFKNSYA